MAKIFKPEKPEKADYIRRMYWVIVVTTIIFMLFVTLGALMPWVAVDYLLFYTWLWIFEPVEVSRYMALIYITILFLLSPFVFPWVFFSKGGEKKRVAIRLRKGVRPFGNERLIYLTNGLIIKVHKSRLYRCGLALHILGRYELYKDGKLIRIEDPDKMELKADERLKYELEVVEEELEKERDTKLLLYDLNQMDLKDIKAFATSKSPESKGEDKKK